VRPISTSDPIVTSNTDTLFADPMQSVAPFRFDASVADVFPDMLQRSIPGYQTILQGLGQITARYAQPNSNLYDLGCSLGAATLTMRRQLDDKGCRIIAVDNSAAMIERCKTHLAGYKASTPVELHCADIRQIGIENASVVTLNFTLQFLARAERQALLQTIYDGMLPGGVLFLSEKLSFDDTSINEALIDLHHEFKRANGYSELEVSQKRNALENVLLTDSREAHFARLQQIGFRHIETWFQCYNFCSMVAIK